MSNIKIAIIGLGYVGSKLHKKLSKHFDVLGYDIDISKCDVYNKTNNITLLNDRNVFIFCLPTPSIKNKPNLNILKEGIKSLKEYIKKDSFIIIESTIPTNSFNDIISPLKTITDNFGYSPERFSPLETDIEDNIKIISANNIITLKLMENIYSKITKLHIIDDLELGIEKAVLSKIIENTQRMVNIQLMNEFFINYPDIFKDSLEAAKTKKGFVKINPGLVGGQCIPMDCYFNDCSETKTYCEKLSNTFFNKIAKTILEKADNKPILIFGVGYKKNSGDITYSENYRLVNYLKSIQPQTYVYDPLANIVEKDTLSDEYFRVKLVNHDIFKLLDIDFNLDLTFED